MIYRNYVAVLLVVCGNLAFGRSAWAGEENGAKAKLNGGYYLLHKLGSDEAKLPLLLDVKHAPPEIVTYADTMSKTGKATDAAIEEMHDRSPSIQFDKNPLPEIEQDVRDSIKADKQHQLLFGTSNSEFVRALLIAQIEASTYGTNLCKVLADQESSPERAATLRKLGARWLGRRDEAFRILRNY
jgi:hypothetical protein